jgi:hypothetical protein
LITSAKRPLQQNLPIPDVSNRSKILTHHLFDEREQRCGKIEE